MRLALSPLLLPAILSGASVVLAQQPATSGGDAKTQAHVLSELAASIVVLQTQNAFGFCPVGMKAERQSSGQTEWVVSLEDGSLKDGGRTSRADARGPNQAGVHVELDAAKDKLMTQAEVAVYYLAPGFRVVPASQAETASGPSGFPSRLRKTFVLSAGTGESARHLAGSLLVGPAASITRVRLLSITYTDGSTWHPANGRSCTAEPGLLLAIAAR